MWFADKYLSNLWIIWFWAKAFCVEISWFSKDILVHDVYEKCQAGVIESLLWGLIHSFNSRVKYSAVLNITWQVCLGRYWLFVKSVIPEGSTEEEIYFIGFSSDSLITSRMCFEMFKITWGNFFFSKNMVC